MKTLTTAYRWIRIPLGVAAILLAYSAQTRIVNGVVPPESVTGYAVATGLFVAAFITTEATRFAGARLFAPVEANGAAARPIGVMLALFVLGIALSAAGMWRFSVADNRSGWLLFVASVVVYATSFTEFSFKRFAQNEERRETEAGGWGKATLRWLWGGVPFLALIGLALALRLPDLGTYPYGFWYDEAAAGLAATRILNGVTPWPIWSPILAVSPHYHFLTAISISLFGPEISTIRMQSVLMGTGTVVLSYLLFRRWFGVRLGLIAAGLWAALRYMIIWSRLGQDWISVLPFETAILLLFDLGLETKKLRYFAWAGLTMGVSIAFYYPNRLFVAVVLVYGLLLLAAWVIRRVAQRRAGGEAAARAMPLRKALGRGAAVVGIVSLSAVLSGMPVGYYALTNWEDFNARQATVSIFTKRDEPDLGKAIQSQIQKHLLMYNVRGDPNPRHNFPGDPMLDPIVGSLAVLGLAYALSRFYRPANALMLLTFVIMIAGAILSIDFEAPQSLRAIGTQPAVVYFAALPLVLLARATGEQLNPLWKRARLRRFVFPPLSVLATLALLAVVGLVTQYSYTAYYIKERNSPAVYTDHSTPETVMAYEMNRLIRDYDLIVTQTYYGLPTVAFLAPEAMARSKMWSGNDPLDLTSDGTRGIAILVDPKLAAAFDQLRRSFPNATFRQFVSPMGGSSELLFEALLSPGDLRDAQGLEARVYPGDTFTGAPAGRIGLSAARADWSAGAAPATAPFAAELRGALNVTRDGPYRFAVRGTSNTQLFIDEFPVAAESVTLARGKHALRLRMPVAASAFELQWQPPGGAMGPIPASVLLKPPATATGLLASYYRNTDWQGAPAFTQIEPEINFYYHILPLPRPYSIEWKGKLFAPVAGAYTLSTDSRDESVVTIDNVVVVNNPNSEIVNATVTLAKGWHDIQIRFVDKTGYTHIYLYWTPPGGARQIIPTRYLAPPLGAYPDADVLASLPDLAPIASVVSQPPGRAETAYAGPVAIVAPSFQLPALTLPSITLPQIIQPRGDVAPAATPQPGKPAPPNQPGVPPPAQPAVVPALNLTAVAVVGKAGIGPGEFSFPHGVAIGTNGRVFVADTGNKRVQALDADGKFLFEIKAGEEPLVEPYDVLIAPGGDLLVLDSDAGWVYRFDQDGKPKGRMGGPELRFYKPRGFGADAAGNIYIADTGRSRVVKLDPDGKQLLEFGERGSGPLQYIETSEIAVSPKGDVYVVDLPNKRVQRLTAELKFVNDFAIPVAGPATGPYIAFAPDGSLLITAPEPHKIQRYSPEGVLKSEIGGFGEGLGGMRLPTGIAIQGATLWVVESGNNRIQRFALNP